MDNKCTSMFSCVLLMSAILAGCTSTATLDATPTPYPTFTPYPTYTPYPTSTPEPTPTSTPTPTQTPTETPTPAPTPTSTPTVVPTPNITVALLQAMRTTRKQMEEYGGWIDRAGGDVYIDAREVVRLYDGVAAAPTFDVSRSDDVVRWAYDCYRQAIDVFLVGAGDMYRGARLFLESDRETDGIPFQQWGAARKAVSDALAILIPAIDRLEQEGY